MTKQDVVQMSVFALRQPLRFLLQFSWQNCKKVSIPLWH